MTNKDIFFKLFLEPFYLVGLIAATNLYCFQRRLQLAYLCLKVRYLSFRIARVVECQRKSLAEYIRYRNLRQGFAGCVNDAHLISISSSANAPREGAPPHSTKVTRRLNGGSLH